jgi:DNA polymerase-3 subunit gamma/tau
MSYQVLARKWRPKRFSEMVGQQHVLKALENALNQDRLHHAYLFTGTRGVGKTTIARIFAKCLNCEIGVSSEPCGTCSICTSIDEGRFLDLMEIDAASHTGVDSIRELLDNTQYTPNQGKYKVYLIDEVHMLSASSFNALLKTLEEPPEHVKFLLATTDPQKLPVTVLSRCLQFNLKAMSATQISGHLKELLEKEMISFEDEALELIAKAADGSMRDALSLADQAIAHGNESLKGTEVRSMLGLVDRAYIPQLMEALLSKDAKTLLACVDQIASDSPNYKSVLAELISFLHRLIIEQVSDADKDAQVKALAKSFTAEDLQLFYQTALKGRQDLSMSPEPRQGMEVCLLRMLLFRPEKLISPNSAGAGSASTSAATPSSQVPSEGGGKAQFDAMKAQFEKKKPELNVSVKQNTTISSEQSPQAPEHPKQPVSKNVPVSDTSVSAPVQENIVAKVNAAKATKAPQETQPQEDASQVVTKTETLVESDKQEGQDQTQSLSAAAARFSYLNIADKWTQIILQLNLSGPAAMIAKNSNLEKVSDTQFNLLVEKKFEMLASQQARETLKKALSNFYGTEIEISFTLGAPSSPTAEQHFQAMDLERSKFAEQSILKDNTVKILQEEFGAQIEEGSSQLIH